MRAVLSSLAQHWRLFDPPYRRLLIWLVVFLVLVCALSIAELSSPTVERPVAESTTATTSPTRAMPFAIQTVTVAVVVDGRTIIGSSGEQLIVEGLAPPGPCWAETALTFAKIALLGKRLHFDDDVVTLPDGEDVAVLMASRGLGRVKAGARPEVVTAQDMAKLASLGLWGAPCEGSDTPAPPPPQPPPPAVTTTVAPPPPTLPPTPSPTPKPSTPQPPSVYYPSCYEAARARAVPLYRGQPGYRRELDPDGDGVACEWPQR